MFEQLLIAYTAGMTLAIGIEVARTLKARRLNRVASASVAMAPAAAPRFASVATDIGLPAMTVAANEPELMRAAG